MKKHYAAISLPPTPVIPHFAVPRDGLPQGLVQFLFVFRE